MSQLFLRSPVKYTGIACFRSQGNQPSIEGKSDSHGMGLREPVFPLRLAGSSVPDDGAPFDPAGEQSRPVIGEQQIISVPAGDTGGALQLAPRQAEGPYLAVL